MNKTVKLRQYRHPSFECACIRHNRVLFGQISDMEAISFGMCHNPTVAGHTFVLNEQVSNPRIIYITLFLIISTKFLKKSNLPDISAQYTESFKIEQYCVYKNDAGDETLSADTLDVKLFFDLMSLRQSFPFLVDEWLLWECGFTEARPVTKASSMAFNLRPQLVLGWVTLQRRLGNMKWLTVYIAL